MSLIQELNSKKTNYYQVPAVGATANDDRIIYVLSNISSKLDCNFNQMKIKGAKQPETIIISDKNSAKPTVVILSGETNKWNIEVRGYMQLGGSSFDFMPEVYTSIGEKTY